MPESRTRESGFLIAGALLGAACALGASSYCRSTGAFWKRRVAEAEEAQPLRHISQPASGVPSPSVRESHHDEILSEQFTRNTQFFGREGQKRVHEAFVIVIGLGVSPGAISSK